MAEQHRCIYRRFVSSERRYGANQRRQRAPTSLANHRQNSSPITRIAVPSDFATPTPTTTLSARNHRAPLYASAGGSVGDRPSGCLRPAQWIPLACASAAGTGAPKGPACVLCGQSVSGWPERRASWLMPYCCAHLLRLVPPPSFLKIQSRRVVADERC